MLQKEDIGILLPTFSMVSQGTRDEWLPGIVLLLDACLAVQSFVVYLLAGKIERAQGAEC